MLTYNLENKGPDSLYEFLYKCIKNDIIKGKLKANEKLPSKRTFAKNLGISVITIENAYNQLIAEGYIYSFPKKGFYVADLKNEKINNTKTDSNEISLNNNDCKYIADFVSNQTDSKIFPFSIWTKTMREIMNENREQLMVNPPCGGIMELRKYIAKYLKDFRCMYVKPEQIIIGAGTEYLYSLIIQLLGNNILYGVENPGYTKIASIYNNMNIKYKYIDIDDNGITANSLERENINVMHISPSHHFPTGIVMPISRRYELLSWASKGKNRYIIEDDYDSELRLSGKPIPTLQSIDVSDKVIYINTFTKTLCSTVRISYMILPENLTEKFYKKLSFYSCTVSNFEQYTLARFIKNGNFEKHINRLRNYYQNKRDLIIKAFESSEIIKYIKITKEDAGVHFLMQIKTNKAESDIVESAKKKGIRIAPISNYYYKINNDYEYRNTYVMNYSSINQDEIENIVSLLYSILKYWY